MSTDFGSVAGTDSPDRVCDSIHVPDRVCDSIHVSRFAGGRRGMCVQLTIGERYVQLDAVGVHKLIEKLARTQYANTAEVEGRACQHCTCAYTASCCHCDGGQVHT